MTTIRDVARAAGVSIATVSRAFSHPEALVPETRERVLRAVAELGWSPNQLARGLKVRSSGSVGVVVPDLANPFQLGVAKGACAALDAAGYAPLICDTDEDPEREDRYLRNLVERRVEGLVLVPSLRPAKAAGSPALPVNSALPPPPPRVCGGPPARPNLDCVRTDAAAGMALIVEHLVQSGRRRIAYAAGPAGTVAGDERNRAFRAACAAHGLTGSACPEHDAGFTRPGGAAAAAAFLALIPRPDAIVAANNLSGLGCLDALRAAGTAVPATIALAVFDETGGPADAPLAGIRQPAREMGAAAAIRLVERIEGRAAGPAAETLLPPLWIEGWSLRPADAPPPRPSWE